MQGNARIRCFSILTLLLVFTSCSGGEKKQERQEPQLSTSITEISLERTECFGTCPAYQVILRSDGTASYLGKKFARRTGAYNGKIAPFFSFDKLARLIESEGFFNLKDEDKGDATGDIGSAITTVVRHGQRKTVISDDSGDSIKLWGINAAIDGVVEQIEWKKEN